ncbi:MAG: Rho termination factor N-terminal domain-containing protein [Bacilli bacterium]
MVDYLTEEDKTKNEKKAAKKEETKEVISEVKEVVEAPVVASEPKEAIKEETVDLSKLTVAELKTMAKDANIEGYTTLKKAELVASLTK